MVHHHCDKTKILINATANPSESYCTVPFMHTLPVIRGETESRCSVTDGRRIHLRTRTGSSTLGFSVSVKIFARLCVYYAFHIQQALVTFWNGWSWSNIGTYLHREDSSSSLQQLCRIICTRNVLSFSSSLSLFASSSLVSILSTFQQQQYVATGLHVEKFDSITQKHSTSQLAAHVVLCAPCSAQLQLLLRRSFFPFHFTLFDSAKVSLLKKLHYSNDVYSQHNRKKQD